MLRRAGRNINLITASTALGFFVLASSAHSQSGPPGTPNPTGKPFTMEDALPLASFAPVDPRRIALRQSVREAVFCHNQRLARQQYLALLALPDVELQDTVPAIEHFQWLQEWPALAQVYQIRAEAMWRVSHMPPEAFIRAPVPDRTDLEAERGGPYVWVQMTLDGQWSKGKGHGSSWIDRIKRKQKDLVLERINVLKKLGTLCMDQLRDPARAVEAYEAAGRGVPICTEALDTLIPRLWPVMRARAKEVLALDQAGAAHIRLEPLQALAEAQVATGKLRRAAHTHTRAMLTALVGANGDWNAHGPSQEAEKFWQCARLLPVDQPIPPTLWLHVLSPERPEMTFRAPEDGPHGYPISFPGPRLVIKPGHTVQSLTVATEMETPDPRGGRGGVRCFTRIRGKAHDLGRVAWYEDGRQGRQWRATTFRLPPETGIIRLDITPYNDTDFHVRNIRVKSTSSVTPSAPSNPVAQTFARADFERLTVRMASIWMHASKIVVTGTGQVTYSMPGATTGNSESYSTMFQLRPEHLRELNDLLEQTAWLTGSGANIHPGYTDATRIDMTLSREGAIHEAWCHDQNPEPYGALVRFLRQINRQETLRKRMAAGSAQDRRGAAYDLGNELDVINGRPLAIGPIRILDLHRFVPVCSEVISNTEANHLEVIKAALKLLGHLQIASQCGTIAELATAQHTAKTRSTQIAAINALGALGGELPSLYVRSLAQYHAHRDVWVNDAIVAALFKLEGVNAIGLLESMKTTPSARWALIRLGEPAVPAIVEVLEETPPRPLEGMHQIHLIRQYIDHWQDVPKPVDSRVINAVKANLNYRLGFSRDWTEYHLQLLELAGASEPVYTNSREVAEEFLRAVKADSQQDIKRISHLVQRDRQERLAALKQLPGLQRLTIHEVITNRDEGFAWAVCFDIRMLSSYQNYVIVFLNFVSGKVWRVGNVYMSDDPAGSARMYRRLLEKYPDDANTVRN
jgi:hypothetical protein